MSDYTPVQQLLHRMALSTRMMREVAFDIEQKLIAPLSSIANEKHVFVSGLARSGTTILMRELYATRQFSSLTYQDMPFVLAPNLWAKLQKQSQQSMESVERAHGDGLRVDHESPEAFEQVFWKTFDDSADRQIIGERAVPDTETLRKFKGFVEAVTRKYGKKRYLSKNNSNVFRMKTLRLVFPSASILVPFRSPLQHANSLLTQHERFSKIQGDDPFIRNYMAWLGHYEFGLSYQPYKPEDGGLSFPNPAHLEHWLEQWFLVYEFVLQSFDEDSAGTLLVCYEALCEKDGRAWRSILKNTSLDDSAANIFSLRTKPIDDCVDKGLLDSCENLYQELYSRTQSLYSTNG
jgi:hypothetical protein